MNEIIQNLVGKPWHYIHRRERSPFYMYLLLDGSAHHYNQALSFPYEVEGIIALDREVAVVEKGWERLRQDVGSQLNQTPHFLLDLLKECYRENQRTEAFVKELKPNTEWTAEDLKADFARYLQLTNNFTAYLLLPLFVEADMEQQLKQYLLDRLEEAEAAQAFQVLTTPIKEGVSHLEKQHLLKMAVMLHKGLEVEEEIKMHLEHFAWLKNNAFVGNFFTPSEIMERVQSVEKEGAEEQYKEFREKRKKLVESFEKYRSDFNDLPAVQALIDTLQESIYFRSWRTERYYCHAYSLQGFFKALAKQLEVSMEDFFYLVPPEIIQGLSGESYEKEKINQRKKAYAIYAHPAQESCTFSGELLNWAKEHLLVNPAQQGKELRGQIAFPGVVEGPACLVLHKEDLKKVQEGDILISPSTTADYVPVLKLVKGIVADEGGVLSHASVISRELRIPCVIGTRTACQTIKDGQLLELDATTGKVRVLS